MAVNLPPHRIGLAVSRRLAKNMGGDITVTSEQGKGSTFTLTIHAPSVAEEVDDAFDEDDMPLPALNVLLVEDIELNVIVARSVLEKLGNSVDVAMTARRRWRCLNRANTTWYCWIFSCQI